MGEEGKPKVLIADDEPDIVYVLSEVLSDEGYDTITAADGEETLRKAKEYKPDIILLDIMMPKMDGYSVNVQLKSQPETKDIPVIVITGRGQLKELFDMNEKAPIDDFLEKPFPVKELLERMDRLLKR